MMEHEVFISYSSQDKIIADAVCHSLEESKIPCWIAPRDEVSGESYAKQIMQAIENCQVLVLFFSENANTSEHVENEIDKGFMPTDIDYAISLFKDATAQSD